MQVQVQVPWQPRVGLFQRKATAEDGNYEERSYTIVRQNNAPGLVLYVRKYDAGLVSPIMHSLQPGDKVRMRGPQVSHLAAILMQQHTDQL